MSLSHPAAAAVPHAQAPLLVALRSGADWTAAAGWLTLLAGQGCRVARLLVGPAGGEPTAAAGGGLPDLAAWDEAVHCGEPLIEALQQACLAHRTDLLIAPSPVETDPLRRALAMACIEAAQRIGGTLQLALYEWALPGRPDLHIDIGPAWARKQQWLAAAGPEGQVQLALNRFRGLQADPPVAAAEAFELVSAADLAAGRNPLFDSRHLRLATQGWPADGAVDLPLVSVLVRSMGLPLLEQALDSISRQTYDAIEVVVVNASGKPHPLLPPRCGRFALRLVEPGRPLARAAAANRALAEARGAWLIFLDDDDLFDAGHVARLRAALAARPQARVAYAGVRLQHADGGLAGELDETFDATRLWFGNYLPIHAVMFHRDLLGDELPFDEQLAVYEDWDFWQRLAQRQAFLHVPGVSATYRLLGQSGLTHARDEALSREARRTIYRKWLPRLDAETLDRLATAGELARGQAREAVAAGEAAIAARARDVAALQAQLAGQQAAHVALTRQLDALSHEHARQAAAQAWEAARQAAEAATAHAAALAQLQSRAETAEAAQAAEAAGRTRAAAELQAALATYAQLEAGYRQVTGSLSWRLTAPLRVLRSLPGRASPARLLRAVLRRLPLSAAHKQQGKVWLAGRPWGTRLLRTVVPQSVPGPGAAPPEPPLDKEAVRAEAEAELTRMLAGRERIGLRRGSGPPQVSVVVVLYNQAGLSLLCLRSLAASLDVEFETLIVDNASTDRMPELLQRLDGATVLRQTENLGFLRAVNLAAGQARGEHLLLLNNDAMVFPDTLARAMARLGSAPDIGAVGGPILLWDGRLQEAGSVFWRDGSCAGYGRGDRPERPEYRFVRDVDYCSGAFLMVRRALFERLGRFDTAYAPAYYEESDFCARLWEAGHRVVYDPQVRIRHFEFASESARGWAIDLQQRHRQLFVERHGPLLATRPLPSPAALLQARQRLRPGALRVLVIDDRVPLPWLGQGYPRAASLVAAIAAGGDFVTHYPLQFPHEASDDVARALPETVEVMLECGLPALADFLTARQGAYDVVIVSRPHNMAVLRAILKQRGPLLQGARIVYDAEALFSLRDIAKAALSGPVSDTAEQQRQIAAEMALATGADCVVAVSEVEAGHYRAAGYSEVQVLGHTLLPVPQPKPFEARNGFLFVGALPADDTPNADSLRWFVGEVWPHIVARLGSAAQLRIVGVCQAPSVLALARPGIQVLGQAEDLAAQLDAARVFIVPTRYAAGVPHKAHEAAARGLPMVVTPLIADQLGWRDRVPVGADPQAFAEACLRLHGDPRHWGQVRDQLLTAVARDCSPAAFERALQAVLGRRDDAAESAVESAAESATSCAERPSAPHPSAGHRTSRSAHH